VDLVAHHYDRSEISDALRRRGKRRTQVGQPVIAVQVVMGIAPVSTIADRPGLS
jgi:hypothetical protein